VDGAMLPAGLAFPRACLLRKLFGGGVFGGGGGTMTGPCTRAASSAVSPTEASHSGRPGTSSSSRT
jgi:hypothetical protein